MIKRIIVDTSAWTEYLRGGSTPLVACVRNCLERDHVAMGDLIYCELMQGIRSSRERQRVAKMLCALPAYEMVGFDIAEKAAANYRLLRSRGLTVRKTIDVLIATFCTERGFLLVHHDRDFDYMAPHIKLRIHPGLGPMS